MNNPFDYQSAFSRNLGWVTEVEQDTLRPKRIAIADIGGVGGTHRLTLTHLGIGSFNIVDMDNFEIANFNCQAGTSMRSINKQKVSVMSELATDINPQLDINKLCNGVIAKTFINFLMV